MKIFKTISTIISWLVVLLVLLVAGSLILSRFNTPIKFRVFSVLSGSMEPNIPVGSLVIVQPADSYQKDDVVTVRSERSIKETVTHRIVNVTTDEDTGNVSYELKGDANEEPDRELISARRVLGKVSFNLPYLGRVVGFAQTQTGFVALVVIPGTILIYSEIMTIKNELLKLFGKKKKSAEPKKPTQKKEPDKEADQEE